MNSRATLLQTQKQILSPVMQQSIGILMMSLGELNFVIEQELQINPLLDSESIDTFPKLVNPIQIRRSLNQINDIPLSAHFSNEDDEQLETPIIQRESLTDHLLRQLRIEVIHPVKLKIGELIIGNLNSNGYLMATIDEIAWLSGTGDIVLVEEVLRIVQSFDPIGIASRDIQECLLIQLNANESPYRAQAIIIIQNHFDDLCHKRLAGISKKTGFRQQDIKQVARLIATLEPKPARDFQTAEQTIYVQPDIFVFKNIEGNFRIEVNKKEIPTLRINPLYQKLLIDKNITDQERKFIQEKFTNAVNFIKSIQQRGETVLKITRYIVDHQKEFFEGDTSSLTPMVLKDIAQTLERNESTISRAIHGKYMETSFGIFPLKFFFSSAVNKGNKDVSSHTVKEEIKTLIEAEDRSHPLSDQDILEYFEKKGLKLARRTINKYRIGLQIQPSHLRKMHSPTTHTASHS